METFPLYRDSSLATDGLDFLLGGFTLQMVAGVLMGMAWCLFGLGSPRKTVPVPMLLSCCNQAHVPVLTIRSHLYPLI